MVGQTLRDRLRRFLRAPHAQALSVIAWQMCGRGTATETHFQHHYDHRSLFFILRFVVVLCVWLSRCCTKLSLLSGLRSAVFSTLNTEEQEEGSLLYLAVVYVSWRAMATSTGITTALTTPQETCNRYRYGISLSCGEHRFARGRSIPACEHAAQLYRTRTPRSQEEQCFDLAASPASGPTVTARSTVKPKVVKCKMMMRKAMHE